MLSAVLQVTSGPESVVSSDTIRMIEIVTTRLAHKNTPARASLYDLGVCSRKMNGSGAMISSISVMMLGIVFPTKKGLVAKQVPFSAPQNADSGLQIVAEATYCFECEHRV